MVLLLLVSFFTGLSGQKRRVLFLGNSYTYANNLPQLIADAASSVNDTLIYDSNAPGGYYLGQHLTNTVSINKITAGNWNYVVLQDQSMSFAYPPPYFYGRMTTCHQLDSTIKVYNPCSQTLFYSTWGRKNGDQYICTPPACPTQTTIVRTYYQMDSCIQTNYVSVADSLKAPVSPVGAVWRFIRRNYSNIELFDPDESHPTLAGSYAAACSFYTAIFRKDPTSISFNSGLSATDAAHIRNAVKITVFNHLTHWNIGKYDALLPSNCGIVGLSEKNVGTSWSVYPNPATEHLNIHYVGNTAVLKMAIYTAQGALIKELEATSSSPVNISDLSAGFYFLCIKNHPLHPVKFIKH